MHKCPLCDGPVSSRIMFHDGVMFVDGRAVRITRTESNFMKLLSHPIGGKVSKWEFEEFGMNDRTLRYCRESMRQKLKGTGLRILRDRGEFYLTWRT